MEPGFFNIRLNGRMYNPSALAGLNLPDENLNVFIREWAGPSDTIEATTSGSTGTPKKIHLKKRHMVHSAKLTAGFFGLTDADNALLCLPVRYIAGKMMVVRAFVTSFNLITAKPLSNPLKGLNSRIDFVAMSPFQLYHSIDDAERLHCGKVLVGGGEMSTRLEERVRESSVEVYASYGMTETCSHVAMRRVNGPTPEEYYTALNGVTFTVDARGCLIIHAPALSDKAVITNDVVDFIDNAHFKWLGRIDHMINSGGVKIYPELLEKKLEGHIQMPFFIASLPDAALGQKIVLYIEKDLVSKQDKSQIQEKIGPLLSAYELPKEIIGMKQFMYTPSGKLMRRQTLTS